MDKTESYIKMSDYPEIQEQWEPTEGDCCVERKYPDIPLYLLEDIRGWGFITGRGWHEDDVFDKDESIWLPYQHQLQAMADEGFTHQCFERFCRWYHSGISQYLSSMEQLWLAFVMKENHGKTWNGKEWAANIEVEISNAG